MYKQQDESADVIYYNGKIYTMDQNMTIVQSFAVKGQDVYKRQGWNRKRKIHDHAVVKPAV